LLRFLRIRPQVRVRRLLFYFRKLLAQFTRVKDTPAGREPWSSEKCIAVPVHLAFFIARKAYGPRVFLRAPSWLAVSQTATTIAQVVLIRVWSAHRKHKPRNHRAC
jgi:hypothetical protein